jgi:hypothetical protein
MGRSVNVPSGSAGVLYFGFDGSDDCMDNSILWSDLVEDLLSMIHSVDKENNRFYGAGENRWIGREGRVISMCSIASMVLSEYCGVCSLAIVPQDEPDKDAWSALKVCWEDFSRQWSEDFFEKLRVKMVEDGFPVWNQVGRFSNGECVYERAAS